MGSPTARDGNGNGSPTMHSGLQNVGTNDDAGRVQPINIGMLKEYMQKRMTKAAAGRKQTGLAATVTTGGNATNLTVTINSPGTGPSSPRGPSTKRPFANTADSPAYD